MSNEYHAPAQPVNPLDLEWNNYVSQTMGDENFSSRADAQTITRLAEAERRLVLFGKLGACSTQQASRIYFHFAGLFAGKGDIVMQRRALYNAYGAAAVGSPERLMAAQTLADLAKKGTFEQRARASLLLYHANQANQNARLDAAQQALQFGHLAWESSTATLSKRIQFQAEIYCAFEANSLERAYQAKRMLRYAQEASKGNPRLELIAFGRLRRVFVPQSSELNALGRLYRERGDAKVSLSQIVAPQNRYEGWGDLAEKNPPREKLLNHLRFLKGAFLALGEDSRRQDLGEDFLRLGEAYWERHELPRAHTEAYGMLTGHMPANKTVALGVLRCLRAHNSYSRVIHNQRSPYFRNKSAFIELLKDIIAPKRVEKRKAALKSEMALATERISLR